MARTPIPRRPRPWPVRAGLALVALWRDPRTAGALPWVLSLALHAGVISLAAAVVWRVRSARDLTPPLVVSFDEPAIAPAMAKPPPPPIEPDPAEALERILSAPAESIPTQAPALAPLPEPPEVLAPAAAEPVLPEPAAEDAPAVEFSGLGVADARDIIYVVDASGSMITSLPTVLDELERSLSRLHPIQRFQVFLFHTTPEGGAGFEWPALPPGVAKPVLIDATRANVRAAIEWARSVPARLRSNPLPALEAALDLRPDAVFLLSAGATDEALLGMPASEALARLDRLNPARRGARPVVIRAIQILDEDPAGLLRRIAEAHGGAGGYKFIGRDGLSSLRPDGAPP